MKTNRTIPPLVALAALTVATQGQMNPPAITKEPTDQKPYVGGRAHFLVAATGTDPLAYQWRFNDTDLPGQTASSLTLDHVGWTDAGAYTVVVSNGGGAVRSDPAWLSVLPTNVVNVGGIELQFGELSPPVWEASREDDGDQIVTDDGRTVIYGSSAPDGSGGRDLWMVSRPSLSSPWGTPVNLGPTINSAADDDAATLSADGLSLYFASNRPGGRGDYDLYVATRARRDAPFGTPVNLGAAINSVAEDGLVVVSGDNRTLIFSSRRAGGLGAYDIYMSTRPSAESPWEPAQHLSAPINSASGGTFPTALSRSVLPFDTEDV